ncbi:hypothetical protein LCGC14_0949950 [marine sediment metagenome]|uniref:Uncharacterized protein n=1 Tax=marine sediment metagenome TaxID=412755 RepID=A0A0F9RP04_9ZZZZ
MTKPKTKPKGKSGLEKTYSTKQHYDSIFKVNDTEIQQENPNEVDKLLDMVKNMPNNQGGNNGGNNNLLSKLQEMKLMKDIFNPQQQQGGNNAMIKMMSDQNRMMQETNMAVMKQMMENSNIKFNHVAQLISGNNHQDPEERLMKSINLVKEIQGEHRERTATELDYDLKRQELIIREQSRQDLLSREERQIIRDDKKSEQFMNIGGVVLDKIVGDNLSTFIGDLMGSGKNIKGRKRRGRTDITKDDDWDPSLLDDL